MPVKKIQNNTELQSELTTAGDKLVVIDFTASWCGPCRIIAPIFEQLSNKYSSTVFLKVDVDECSAISESYSVTAMPTFVFIRNSSKITQITGGDPKALEKKISELAGGPDDGESSGVPGHIDLNSLLNKPECECLNEADDHPYSHCLTSGGGYLESDCDEQLILSFSYIQPVKIHSLKVKAPRDKGPKNVRLFINQPRTLDFDQADSITSVQDLVLEPNDLSDDAIIPLRYVKFQNVQNLQIFFKDNQENTETTQVDYLTAIGSPISATKMGEFKRITSRERRFYKKLWQNSGKHKDRVIIANFVVTGSVTHNRLFNRMTDEIQAKKFIFVHDLRMAITHQNFQEYIGWIKMTKSFIRDYNKKGNPFSEFSLTLIMTTAWNDERLDFTHLVDNSTNLRLIRSIDCEKKIWTPALNIINEKSTSHGSKADGDENFCRIFQNGTIHYFSRMKLTLSCAMDLHQYPFDKQKCQMEAQSWLLPQDDLILKFREYQPFSKSENLNLIEFKLVGYNLQKSVKSDIDIGQRSVLIIEFHLEREFGFYLLNHYIPSSIFVVASWTSFWLHPEAGPPRVTLALTTMLTLVTSAKNSVSQLPKITYIKALDIWNVACTGIILLSLFEFTIVNVLARRGRHMTKKAKEKQEKVEKECNKSEQRSLSRSYSTHTICQEEITGIHRSVSRISLTDDCSMKENNNFLFLPNRTPNFRRSSSTDSLDSVIDIKIEVPVFSNDLKDTEKVDDEAKAESSTPEKVNKKFVQIKNLLLNIFKLIKKWCCLDASNISKLNSKQLATAIDRNSRILFPVIFLIFNIVYWSILS
ncbi:Thioredoxin-like protein 1 [Nymphon striatum]|nr:Thioredoxin-like protein 1 [Nymphon striatum]